jgi:hypothetical protein
LTPYPLEGPSAASNPAAGALVEILEETIAVKVYSWRCDKCQRTLHHRDRRTLEHNIEEHQVQRHGENVERRRQLQDIQKQVIRISRTLNRRFG